MGQGVKGKRQKRTEREEKGGKQRTWARGKKKITKQGKKKEEN